MGGLGFGSPSAQPASRGCEPGYTFRQAHNLITSLLNPPSSPRLGRRREILEAAAVRNHHPERYDEETFTHLLAVECARAERSEQPFLLLLVEGPDGCASIEAEIATQVFAGLKACLRETVYVGWYRSGTVVGAVLSEFRHPLDADTLQVVRRRVSGLMAEFLPSHAAERLCFRMIPYTAPRPSAAIAPRPRGHSKRGRSQNTPGDA